MSCGISEMSCQADRWTIITFGIPFHRNYHVLEADYSKSAKVPTIDTWINTIQRQKKKKERIIETKKSLR